MRDFSYLTEAVRIAILAGSLLAMASYARWHLWWRSGFGRVRMAALVSVASLALVPLLYRWTGVDNDFSSRADDAVSAIDLTALVGVLTWVSYTLYRVIKGSIRRVRHPEDTADEARRHLQQTPYASREDIEKLLAYWDEMHGQGDDPTIQ